MKHSTHYPHPDLVADTIGITVFVTVWCASESRPHVASPSVIQCAREYKRKSRCPHLLATNTFASTSTSSRRALTLALVLASPSPPITTQRAREYKHASRVTLPFRQSNTLTRTCTSSKPTRLLLVLVLVRTISPHLTSPSLHLAPVPSPSPSHRLALTFPRLALARMHSRYLTSSSPSDVGLREGFSP
ncbi:hypothetical protein L210DRAFT_3653745 [Boletus edulis BED1]|uniref:Uncharacterized protein n=1 Tax=Boletus edulis BED1 TaxID=1328754 RepID=A0AAD4BF40_BOLED|nr:hypothetical protein L210DRAFT_3653745 [Boletus edulis BED1]